MYIKLAMFSSGKNTQMFALWRGTKWTKSWAQAMVIFAVIVELMKSGTCPRLMSASVQVTFLRSNIRHVIRPEFSSRTVSWNPVKYLVSSGKKDQPVLHHGAIIT